MTKSSSSRVSVTVLKFIFYGYGPEFHPSLPLSKKSDIIDCYMFQNDYLILLLSLSCR